LISDQHFIIPDRFGILRIVRAIKLRNY